MKGSLAFFFLTIISPQAQILGAFESFSEESNATSWATVDFSDLDAAFEARWRIPGSSDPEIYTTFDRDFETSLFADELSSGAAFVGDYDAAGIDLVQCDVYVEDFPTFAELEIYLLAGDTFYYSDLFTVDEAGWSFVEYSFTRDPWYFYDDDAEVFVPVELTPVILSEVAEIGVTFYPGGPGADGQIIGLDNFTLLPDLTTPALALAQGILSFTGREGLQFSLEASRSMRANRWNEVGEPFEADGFFQRQIPQNERRFFRLKSRPFYVELPLVERP